MPVLVSPAGITYRCDICDTTTDTPQRCYRAVTDEAGDIVAGTENTYCEQCQCTALTERDLHEHHTLTSPCDGTTCLTVTVASSQHLEQEAAADHLHTHRGDPHWFYVDPHEPFEGYPERPARHLRLVPRG